MTITIEEGVDQTNGLVGIWPDPETWRGEWPTITGTRSDDAMSADIGETVAYAQSGQRYANLCVRNVGNGLVRIPAATPVGGLTIEDVDISRAYRMIECDDGATLSNFRISRITGTLLERGIGRFRSNCGPGLIEDVWADLRGHIGDRFAVAFAFDEGCHDITVQRCFIGHSWTSPDPTKYRQGDGISDEVSCYNMTYRDVHFYYCIDGGLDSKSANLYGDNLLATRCSKSFRLWNSGRFGRIESVNPTKYHIHLCGTNPTYEIDHLVLRSPGDKIPLITVETNGTGGHLKVNSWDIQGMQGSRIVNPIKGNVTIDWGPQGVPPHVIGGNGLLYLLNE